MIDYQQKNNTPKINTYTARLTIPSDYVIDTDFIQNMKSYNRVYTPFLILTHNKVKLVESISTGFFITDPLNNIINHMNNIDLEIVFHNNKIYSTLLCILNELRHNIIDENNSIELLFKSGLNHWRDIKYSHLFITYLSKKDKIIPITYRE